MEPVKVYNQEYCYPVIVQAPQPRCDRSSVRRGMSGKGTAEPIQLAKMLVFEGSVPIGQTGKRAAQLIAPRLVYKKEAAFYCGIGVESFTANCPVAPVRVGPGMRGLRYDLYDLDGWIDSLKQSSTSTESNKNWLDRVGNDESAD